jgi:hypothetical protein
LNGDDMKRRTYEKPILVKRDLLPTTTGGTVT